MGCVVSDPVEESFISLVTMTGEGRRAVATIPPHHSNQKFIWIGGVFSPLPSAPFLPLPFLSPFSTLFPPPPSAPSNPAKEFGGPLLAPSAGRMTFAATGHVPWALNIHRAANAFFGLFRAHRTCLVAANVVLFLLSEI